VKMINAIPDLLVIRKVIVRNAAVTKRRAATVKRNVLLEMFVSHLRIGVKHVEVTARNAVMRTSVLLVFLAIRANVTSVGIWEQNAVKAT